MASDFRTVSGDFLAAPQIGAADLAAAAEQGVRLVVNNRPDAEEPGQPASAEIEAAAREAGLAYAHIPIDHRGFSAEHVEALHAAIAAAPGKTLAYCRSGTRSTLLWALMRAKYGDEALEAIADAAAQAGYDVRPVWAPMRTLRDAPR